MPWVRRIHLGGWTVTVVDVAATGARLSADRVRAAVLTPEEAEIYRTLRFDRRRQEWLAGRLAAKLALRHWCAAQGITPPPLARMTIAGRNGTTGAPVSPIGGAVSISHSHGLAAAVAGFMPIGVDIEKLRQFSASARAIFLTGRERNWLRRAERERPELLTLAWTFKEAFCKAHGFGVLGGLPLPEWQSWESDGQLRWRWPECAPAGCAPRTSSPGDWDAYGQILDGYAITVVGDRARPPLEESA